MKKIVLSLALLFSLAFSYAVEGVFYGTPVNKKYLKSANTLEKIFSAYSIYQIDEQAIFNYVNGNRALQQGQAAKLSLNLGNQFSWEIDLSLHDVLSPEFTLRENTLNGIVLHPRPKPFTYRGYMAGGPVAFGINQDFISGYVTDSGKEYFIESMRRFDKSSPPNRVVVYAADDVIASAEASCGYTDMNEAHHLLQPNNKYNPATVAACQLTEIAIAADNSMILAYGSTAAVATELTNRLNMVSAWYSATFTIEYTIITFYITSIPNDITPDSEFDSQSILADFRAWGNAGGFGVSKDIASFFTDRNICDGTNCGNIGYSYFAGICNGWGYNVLEDYGSNPTTSRNYWCHECGHTWNAIHTFPQTTTTFMNPTIYSTSNNVVFASTTTEILNFKNLCTCLDICVGVGETTPDALDFILYPNPSNGMFNVEGLMNNEKTLEVVDVLGNIVYRTTSNEQRTTIDLSAQAKGIYFLKITVEDKTITKKLIIQ